jgi:cell division protein FtsI/penicillin-binding protein 2
LENGLDPILRGEQYQPTMALWLNHVLYGLPSPGLDVRLSLDIDLQLLAAELLTDETGAAVLLDPTTGEVLTMVSQPGYDANELSASWDEMLNLENSPLLNRAAQGSYPPGTSLGPFLLAAARADGIIPNLPTDLTYRVGTETMGCVRQPAEEESWDALVAAGCPGALAELGVALGGERLLGLFNSLGLYTPPSLPLDLHAQELPTSIERPGAAAAGQDELRVSPLQMAYAAATLSHFGQLPGEYLVLEIEQTGGGWLELPANSEPIQAIHSTFALATAQNLANASLPIWEVTGRAFGDEGQIYTWYLAGTLPGESEGGLERCIVVLLESDNPALARSVGQTLLMAALDL